MGGAWHAGAAARGEGRGAGLTAAQISRDARLDREAVQDGFAHVAADWRNARVSACKGAVGDWGSQAHPRSTKTGFLRSRPSWRSCG